MQENLLFERALEINNAEMRQAFLDRECENAPNMRARLAVLLQAHEQPDPFFDNPPSELAATAMHSISTESLGTSVGPYKLLEIIGEGGMGTVYMAEQTEPVRRRVALKLIKLGMDSKQGHRPI